MGMMELLKILLGVSLIFITVTFATDNIELDESFNRQFKSIKPIAYNVTLLLFRNKNDYKYENIYETEIYKRNIYERFKLFKKQRSKDNFVFYGESVILFRDFDGKRIIRLHVRKMIIDTKATKIYYFANGTNHKIAPKKQILHKEAQTIDIDFDYPFLQDISTYRLIMKFVGSITDKEGIIRTSYINDKGEKTWLFAADFQGAGARQIFPCWDEPDIRTNFTIFVKHDENYRALSNTGIMDTLKVNHGKNWTIFEPTVKISPHHIMIVLHDLERVNDTNMWCRQHVKQQILFVLSIAKFATHYLKLKLEYDNIICPLTVTHVVIPGFRGTGLPSWGIVLHKESDVIYDEKLDFSGWKVEVAFMTARKIAHQYVGNLVAQSSWSYLWLNEGIATFLAMKIVNQHEHPRMMDLSVVKFQHESLRLNEYYDMSLIHKVDTPSDIDSLFLFTHYVTAPIFIRSLDKALPEEILDISINDYISKYKFRSVSTSPTTTLENFFNVIQKNILRDASKEYINVTKRFTQWIKQEHYPELYVKRMSYNKARIKIYAVEECPEELSIYVTYTTQTHHNIIHKKWLEAPCTEIGSYVALSISTSDWIIINVQQAGYYRVNYDKDIWGQLINYLNSMDYFNIHVLNRAQIIDDAYYFLSINKFDFSLFKALTNYLSQEIDYVAWYPMFKILEQISSFFPFPQSSEVKEHFRKILDNVLNDIGYLEASREDVFIKCLRLEAAKWACTLNSQNCMTAAVSNLMRLYEKPDYKTNPIVALADIVYKHLDSKEQLSNHSRIWPGWKEWTYCKGMMLANNITWNKVLTADALDNKRLEYLACSENHAIIIGYINRLMSAYFTEEQHRITVFHSIIARHAKNDSILDYLIQNFENIIPSEIETSIALTDIINYIYSREQINKVKDILLKKVHVSVKTYSYIGKKIELRLLEIEKHSGYFESFLKIKS